MKKYIVRGDIPKEPAMIIEGQLIISPGTYYGISLSSDKIKEHIRLTDWTDKFSTSLVYGHRTNTNDKWMGNPSPDDCAGHYSAPTYMSLSDGVSVEGAYSNLFIYDENLAKKLAYGKLKCGVSATFDLQNGGIKNVSIVDNPMCKQAYLNLSDAGGELEAVEIISPSYLNLSNLPTTERRENSKTMNNKTENEIELEKKIEELEKQIADKATKENPNDEDKTEPVKTDPVEVVDEPKADPVTPELIENVKLPDPVVITDATKDNTEVVDAINKMSDKMAEGLKKAAEPQSVAPTSPNQISSRDDEVTQTLVEKYKSLHDIE